MSLQMYCSFAGFSRALYQWSLGFSECVRKGMCLSAHNLLFLRFGLQIGPDKSENTGHHWAENEAFYETTTRASKSLPDQSF